MPGPRYRARGPGPVPRADLCRHHRHRARGDPPRGADPLADPARQAVPRLRPDPGQGRAAAWPTCRPAWPAAAPAATATAVQAEIAAILKPRWVAEVITVTLTGDAPGRAAAVLAHRHPAPASALEAAAVRQTDPVHQPRRLDRRRRRGRLPLPVRRRSPGSGSSRTPTWSRSARCTTGPTPRSGCTSSTASSPSTVAHLMRRQADHAGLHLSVRELLDHPRRHRRNRAALPRRRQGTPPRPTHAHRPRPDPTSTRRPVRHPPVRAHPLTTPHRLR